MSFSPVRDVLARCARLHDAIADQYAQAAVVEDDAQEARIFSLLAARERETQALIQRFVASDGQAVATWLQLAGLPQRIKDPHELDAEELDQHLAHLYGQLDGSMAPRSVKELIERIEERRQHDQRRSSFAAVAERQMHAR